MEENESHSIGTYYDHEKQNSIDTPEIFEQA